MNQQEEKKKERVRKLEMRTKREFVRNKVQQAYLVAAVFSVASGASLKTSDAKMPKTNAVFILTLVPSFLSCWKHTYVVESLLCSPPNLFSSKKMKKKKIGKKSSTIKQEQN